MGPFGIEHEVSKALTPAERKQKKHHEKRTYQNLAGGITGVAAGTTMGVRAGEKKNDAIVNGRTAKILHDDAMRTKSTVEARASQGRVSPKQANVLGTKYREYLKGSDKYARKAGQGLAEASRSKKAAVAVGAAGVGMYGNAFNHAIKHDKLEQKGRQRIKKSAFGIEH